MADDPPDRATISFPTDAEIDLDQLDDLVDESDLESRSEYIRQAIRATTEDDETDP